MANPGEIEFFFNLGSWETKRLGLDLILTSTILFQELVKA